MVVPGPKSSFGRAAAAAQSRNGHYTRRLELGASSLDSSWSPDETAMGRIHIKTDSINLKTALLSTDQDLSRHGVMFRKAKFLLLCNFLAFKVSYCCPQFHLKKKKRNVGLEIWTYGGIIINGSDGDAIATTIHLEISAPCLSVCLTGLGLSCLGLFCYICSFNTSTGPAMLLANTTVVTQKQAATYY